MLTQYSNQNINWNAYCNGTHSITLLPTSYVQILGAMLSFEINIIEVFYVTRDNLESKFCLFSTGRMRVSYNF